MNAAFDLTGLLPHQRTFVLDDREEWTSALICGYGGGKSTALALRILLLAARYAVSVTLAVSPTYRLARDVMKPSLEREAARRAPWLRLRWVAQDSLFVLPDFGSKILLRSGDAADRLVGVNADVVAVDEGGLVDDDALRTALSRARVGPKMACVASTPEGTGNALFQLFGAGDDPARRISVVHGRVWPKDSAAPFNTVKYFSHRPELLRAYLHGEFTPLYVGRCYPSFDRTLVAPQPIDHGAELLLGVDFNIVPSAWTVVQRRRGAYAVVGELSERGAGSTAMTAEAFVRRYRAGDFAAPRATVYGDASGRNRGTRSVSSDYDIVQKILGDAGWQVAVRVPAANGPVVDRVNALDRMLAARELLVDPSCERLIASLERTSWVEGKREISKPSGEDWTHHGDALSYLAVAERPVRGRAVVATNAAPLVGVPTGFSWNKKRAAGF